MGGGNKDYYFHTVMLKHFLLMMTSLIKLIHIHHIVISPLLGLAYKLDNQIDIHLLTVCTRDWDLTFFTKQS